MGNVEVPQAVFVGREPLTLCRSVLPMGEGLEKGRGEERAQG